GQQRKDEVRAGCHQFMNDPKSHKEKLAREHRNSDFLDRIEFSEFYGRLKAIKEYHRRNETVEPLELEFINQTKSNGEKD
ncbi:32275_t:CDS:2, partial [Racocetra persica]